MTTGDIMAAATGLLGAAMAGVYFGFSLLVMPGLRQRPDAEALTAMQSINRSVRWAFLLLFGGSTAVAIAAAIIELIDWSPPQSAWRLAGATLVLLHFVITAAFHIPRNTAVDRLDPAGDADLETWRSVSAQWTWGNHIRGLTAFVGSAILIGTML